MTLLGGQGIGRPAQAPGVRPSRLPVQSSVELVDGGEERAPAARRQGHHHREVEGRGYPARPSNHQHDRRPRLLRRAQGLRVTARRSSSSASGTMPPVSASDDDALEQAGGAARGESRRDARPVEDDRLAARTDRAGGFEKLTCPHSDGRRGRRRGRRVTSKEETGRRLDMEPSQANRKVSGGAAGAPASRSSAAGVTLTLGRPRPVDSGLLRRRRRTAQG